MPREMTVGVPVTQLCPAGWSVRKVIYVDKAPGEGVRAVCSSEAGQASFCLVMVSDLKASPSRPENAYLPSVARPAKTQFH